jgi:rhamnulokinase
VLAGPVEATAVGNVMMQAVADGDIGSIRQARDVIRDSFEVEEFLPQSAPPWDEAFARFGKLLAD